MAASRYGNAELAPRAFQLRQGLDELEQALGSHQPADVYEPQRPIGVVGAKLIGEPGGIDGVGDQMDVYASVEGPICGQLRAGEHRDHVARDEKAPEDPGEKGTSPKEILGHRSAVNLVDDAP